jgi:hypothetical protein
LEMGTKPITDKDSWTSAKKIINARLQRASYWPGESKELVTTDANAATSVWWEEVIAYYCQPPVSYLFMEESHFDGKGFDMIAHINQHCNPSLGRLIPWPTYLTSSTSGKQTKNLSTPSRLGSPIFSPPLKWGVSTLTQPFRLDSCSGHYSPNIKQSSKSSILGATHLPRLVSKLLSNNAPTTIRTLGRAQLDEMASQPTLLLPMLLGQILTIHTMPLRLNPSTTTSAIGRKLSEITKVNA